jgi:geranylgeranyl pyrophosphate synthase
MILTRIYAALRADLDATGSELDRQIGSVVAERRELAGQYERLRALIEQLRSVRGKLLRPVLVLLAARSAGAASSPAVIQLAAATELLHSASLIHDDIIDETEVRREQVAVHKRFGTQMAVLIGDVLYAQFFTVLARLPATDSVRVALFERFCAVTRDMCLGEIVQQGALRGELPARERLYHDVIDSKTAGLMSGCCYGGALVAGVSAERADAYARFGRAFGMVFQLIDDYLDGDAVYGDRAALPGRARRSAEDARAELDGFEPGTATEHLASLLRYTLARPRHEAVA